MKNKLTIEDIKSLLEVKNQLIELDLSNTNFNDEMSNVLKDLPRLKVLRLDQTNISDDALNSLKVKLWRY